MKKGSKKKKIVIVVSVLVVLAFILLVFVSTNIMAFAYNTIRCGKMPVEASNFAASYSYSLPGDKDYEYGTGVLASYYDFCTEAEAEAEGYSRSIFAD